MRASPGLLFSVSIALFGCRLLLDWPGEAGKPTPSSADPLFALALDSAAFFLGMLAFVRLRMDRASKAIQAERQRIAQDLHDGLGFHLMMTVSLTRDRTDIPADLKLALELAIVELHSIVHFVHSPSIPIVDAMASLRYRLQPVIDRRGLELAWHIDESTPADVLVGTPAYHFIKVVQEALSNVLQHAQASRLEVNLRYQRRKLQLEIVDNGRGIDPAAKKPGSSSRGRGLQGMYRRAELMRSRLEIGEPPGGGTSVRLTVPLPCRVE